MQMEFFLLLISGIFVSVASGIVGSFLILKKMSLISDALSHITLPGIALGVVFGITPMWFGLLFLFLGILIILFIEDETNLSIETITGVIFVTALAAGSLIIPETDLLEAFFGNIEKITPLNALYQAIIAIFIIILSLAYHKKIILSSIASDLASSINLSNFKIKFILLMLVAFTISIGINFVGILLISALTIIPAATSKNISKNLKQFLFLSALISSFSMTFGIITNHYFQIKNAGGIIVIINSALFAVSFILSKTRWKLNKTGGIFNIQ